MKIYRKNSVTPSLFKTQEDLKELTRCQHTSQKYFHLDHNVKCHFHYQVTSIGKHFLSNAFLI